MELGFRKWEHQLPFDTEEDLSGLPTRLFRGLDLGRRIWKREREGRQSQISIIISR